ncbi:hypothetical protein [Oceanobacillus damuensis]|uniref:hypothetical protein n=1 Tax=Oceanobacillus damuensis TaxID=937928 RepID=UPI000AA60013|nr:hypothetical protein [Oceanobacillus damuensis]
MAKKELAVLKATDFTAKLPMFSYLLQTAEKACKSTLIFAPFVYLCQVVRLFR